MHLICDLTHRLLALSPRRERQCRVPASGLIGRSLWRYATEDIVRAEQALDRAGWFAPAPPALEFETAASQEQDVLIAAGRMRWVRLQLSDGSFARLVETVEWPPAATAVHASASTHATSSSSAAS